MEAMPRVGTIFKGKSHPTRLVEVVQRDGKLNIARKGIPGRGKPVEKHRAQKEQSIFGVIFNIWICLSTVGRNKGTFHPKSLTSH